MDENNQMHRAPASNPLQPQAQRVPYQRNVRHISQEPITDDALTRPATPAAPGTAQRPSNSVNRKHMGVATSDPQYLQPVGGQQPRPNGPAHPRHKNPGDGEPQTLHGDRYLSTPTSRKTIFTTRHNRARKRNRLALVALLVIVVVAIVWLLFFK